MGRRCAWVAVMCACGALAACDADAEAPGVVRDAADAAAADSAAPADSAAEADTEFAADAVLPGDTVAPSDTAPPGDTSGPASCPAEAVTVYLYTDGDGASSTFYDQPQGPDDAPLVGATVRLWSPGAAPRVALDCGPGRYGFLDLPPGPHQLDVAVDRETTSNNVGRALSAAIARGDVKILTFGDSIPAYGPKPWFPTQLAELLDPLVAVDNVNQAIPGSQTVDWLPHTGNFDDLLAPHLADADVIVFSLGGNDLMDLAYGAEISSAAEALALLDELDVALVTIEANLASIYAALRAAAPDADILWFLYPNYAASENWAPYLGEYQELAAVLMAGKLDEVRERMAALEGVLIADMHGSLDKPTLDSYLWDELHLNVPGHRYYAEEVFMTLGGVWVDATAPRGLDRAMGFVP